MARKICVIISSRAHYGRLKPLLKAIGSHPGLELQLVVGASALLERVGNPLKIIENDGFRVMAKVYTVVEGENPSTMAKSTGLGLLELPTIFENLKPDIVLTHADRFETLANAIAATYMNIPLAHTQGGEVTGSIDESVRHAITKLAHLHFPATKLSGERITRMGEDPKSVFVVGDPAMDLIADMLAADGMKADDGILDKYGGVGGRIDLSKPYLIMLQHPVTTEYLDSLSQINETLSALYELRIPVIALWPNIDAGADLVSKGIRAFRETRKPEFMHFYKNFSPEDYLRLLYNCKCLVGNSSSGIREASFLGVPAVNIGSRQQGRERGANVVDVGYGREAIKDAVGRQVEHGRYPQDHLYGDGKSAGRIADILSKCELKIQKRLAY